MQRAIILSSYRKEEKDLETYKEHDKADITDKLNELVYLLSHTRDIRVNGHTIPDYMAMNLFAPLSATLQYTENIKSE